MKHLTPVRVIYADTDAMGIVYHTNYIRWFEIGRTELLRHLGLVYADWGAKGFHLPVIEVYCQYLQAARYDQTLLIETEVGHVNRATVKFNYTIWDESKEREMAEGYTIHACINAQGKVIRLPWDMIEIIKRAFD
ncbi:MAG TPA: thioesterase family protein [Syntrophales bacterium]|nr:thioesterase family protein [Syntrophales bacterium]HOL58531.1 thioesterase family protein [Syntrophales bacterium]HPO34861.1 thioesterase family protein [Syntrophales bacterium]